VGYIIQVAFGALLFISSGLSALVELLDRNVIGSLFGIGFAWLGWLLMTGARERRHTDQSLGLLAAGVRDFLDLKGYRHATGEPYVRGKVVPVNRLVDGTFSERPATIHALIYSSLPRELRATSPEEAETIVLLDWTTQRVGTYGEGRYQGNIPALKIRCTATVVDQPMKTITGTHTWTYDPPASVTIENGVMSDQPLWEMLVPGYLKQLQRKETKR
jgi:hypothetical protein